MTRFSLLTTAALLFPLSAFGQSAASSGGKDQFAAFVTVNEGQFKDPAGNVYWVRSDGAAMMNDQPTPGGYGTQAMAYVDGVVWGQDAHTNIWWTFSTREDGWTKTNTSPQGLPTGQGLIQPPAIAPVPTPVSAPAPDPMAADQLITVPNSPADPSKAPAAQTTQCTVGGGAAQFSVRDGKIIDPSGKVFIPQGISVVDATLPQAIDGSGNPLLTRFPHMNIVRIAVWSGYNQNDQGIQNAVEVLTGMGIVVQINNYNGPNAINAGDVGQEVEWIRAWATRYKNNPRVWFGAKNEPQDGSERISTEHKAFYDAVRSTGNRSMVSFDLVGGSGTNGLDGSVYGVMSNVSFDAHYYDWLSGYSVDMGANQNALAAEVSAIQNLGQSADGTIPVFIGEWGDATDGANIDAGWKTVVSLILSSGFGQVAFVYFCPGCDGDQLTQGGGGLTEFGRMVADGIAKNATQMLAGCDRPAPTLAGQ